MRKEIQLAGFGGQGVISIGIFIASAAGKFQGMEVAQTQSYGPEARGGACKAEVVISDVEIDYIKALQPNVFLAMSQPALDKYVGKVNPEECVLIIDETLIDKVPENMKNVYRIPATKLAEEKLGMRVVANVIMFGALTKISGIDSQESGRNALKDNIPPNF
jgi:2-oxoglutarate ferredoxin oxidoreductase subunit gamma